MDPLITLFQEATGCDVAVAYGNIGTIADRLRKGEASDLAVVSPEQWDRLWQEKVLLPTVRAPLARIGIALAVRTGSLKPDVGSIMALKHFLLAARSIAIVDPAKGSPSGIRALKLFEQLGIEIELQPKKKLVEASEDVFKVLASGEAAVGINQASEVAASPDVESAGALSADVQLYTTFVAGIPTTAIQVEATKEFLEFLMSPGAVAVFKAKEIEAGEGRRPTGEPSRSRRRRRARCRPGPRGVDRNL